MGWGGGGGGRGDTLGFPPKIVEFVNHLILSIDVYIMGQTLTKLFIERSIH